MMEDDKEVIIQINEQPKDDVQVDLNLNLIDNFHEDDENLIEPKQGKFQNFLKKAWNLVLKGKEEKKEEKTLRDILEICDGMVEEEDNKPQRNLSNCFGLLKEKNFDNLFGLLPEKRKISLCFGLKKESKKKKEEKLGWFSGVFVPIVLDCFGVILFFRIPMAVGNAGIIPTIIMFCIGYLICILTVSSASAIVTNGLVEAGGPYFMISRIMGRVVGGAVGIVLFLGNIFGTSLYIIGFIDAAENSFPYLEHFLGFDEYTSRVLIGTMLLVVCVVINILGAKSFEKATIPIFIVLIISIIAVVFSFCFLKIPIFSYVHDYIEERGYTGFTLETIFGNMIPLFSDSNPYQLDGYNCTDFVVNNETVGSNCTVWVTEEDSGLFDMGEDPEAGGKLNFAKVFGILFPACTGILAGTSLSGDLKNPGKAIPKGSISGIIFTFILYMFLILAIGMTTERTALMYDYDIEIEVSFFPWVVRVGIFCATVSSALTSLLGSSRILNSISMDNIFPFLGLFSYESMAIIGSAVLVEFCIFLGRMNLIAPFVTLFFILTFAIINFSTFMLSFLKAPNFRPTFHLYSWISCLIGAVLCIIIMLVVNWEYSLLSFVLVGVISIIIYFYTRKQKSKWGSLSLAFQTYVSSLFQRKMKYKEETHVKYWRFTGLFLVSNPKSQYDAMNFFANFSKKTGGLIVFGHIMTGKFRERIAELEDQKKAYANLIEKKKWGSFFDITFSKDFNKGVEDLLMTSGLGKITPRIVMLGYYDLKPQFEKLSVDGSEKTEELKGFAPVRMVHENRMVDLNRFMNAIKDCLLMKKSLIIHKNFQNISEHILKPTSLLKKIIKAKVFSIDVWLMIGGLLDLANPSVQLSLQLGHMINNGDPNWKNYHKLRIFFVTQGDIENGMTDLEKKQLKIKIERTLDKLRITGEVKLIEIEPNDIPEKKKEEMDKVEKLIRKNEDKIKDTDAIEEKREKEAMIRPSKTENVNLRRSQSFFKSMKQYDSFEFGGHIVEYNNVYPVLYREDMSKLGIQETMKVLNKLISKHSKEANCVITPLPPIPQDFSKEKHKNFYKEMNILSRLSVPLLMVHALDDVISVTI